MNIDYYKIQPRIQTQTRVQHNKPIIFWIWNKKNNQKSVLFSLFKGDIADSLHLRRRDFFRRFRRIPFPLSSSSPCHHLYKPFLALMKALHLHCQRLCEVGRMVCQFAKPRSDSFEERNGVKLPSYRGDNINGDAFDSKSRIPDPQKMIRAYCQFAGTLNLIESFCY